MISIIPPFHPSDGIMVPKNIQDIYDKYLDPNNKEITRKDFFHQQLIVAVKDLGFVDVLVAGCKEQMNCKVDLAYDCICAGLRTHFYDFDLLEIVEITKAQM